MAKHPVTRRLEFDAGHRLLGHESKCANYHGHRYVVEVTCTEDEVLDRIGRVIDFSVIKSVLGGWLDEHWDHGMLLQEGDPMIRLCESEGTKHFVLVTPPTAEEMSAFLFILAANLLRPHLVNVVKLRLYETPNCWAEYPG